MTAEKNSLKNPKTNEFVENEFISLSKLYCDPISFPGIL